MANCHRAMSTVPKTAPAIGGVLPGVVDTTTRSRSPSQPPRQPCPTSPAASLDQGPQGAGTTVCRWWFRLVAPGASLATLCLGAAVLAVTDPVNDAMALGQVSPFIGA